MVSAEVVDCSEIVDNTYVKRSCEKITLTSETYHIKRLTKELASKLNTKHIKEAIVTGKPVTFYRTEEKINSIFPPRQLVSTFQISFENDGLVVKEVKTREQDLSFIFVMTLIFITTLISGFSGKISFNLRYRPAFISIFVGVTVGMIIGVVTGSTVAGIIAGAFAGIIAGIIAGTTTAAGTTGASAGAIAGANAGAIAGNIVGAKGLTAIITLEWLGFCLLMMALEYVIVFYRNRQAKEKLTKATLN